MKFERAIQVAVAAVGVVMLAACGDKENPRAPAVAVNSAPAAQAGVAPPQEDRSGCPATGLWAVCSVEKRLKQSGFVAQKNDSALPRRAGFSVKPEVYTLNRSRLELYFYPDAASLNRELANVDTASVAPVFVRTGNLAALLFTDDATQAERLSLALTAGAPQPVR